ncbi:hypothetical protein [Burkholderia pyrrocinia]
MTIVALWYSNQHDTLHCAADTRISRGSAVATDSGPKVLPVPVVCHEETGVVGFPVITKRLNYGFAYCGATLGAISAYSLATACTQNLSAVAGFGKDVSVEAVAKLFTTVANHYLEDVAMRLGLDSDISAANFELVVFGYCAVKKDFKAYHIKPAITDGLYRMASEELVVTKEFIFVMGSGAMDFTQIHQEQHEEKKKRISPFETLKELLKRESRKDVGGAIQFGMAGKAGFRIVPILDPIGDPSDWKVTFVGWDSTTAGDVDGYQIGYYGVTIDN